MVQYTRLALSDCGRHAKDMSMITWRSFALAAAAGGILFAGLFTLQSIQGPSSDSRSARDVRTQSVPESKDERIVKDGHTAHQNDDLSAHSMRAPVVENEARGASSSRPNLAEELLRINRAGLAGVDGIGRDLE